MNTITYCPPARLAVAAGLAGAWMILSATTLAVKTPQPDGAMAGEPDPIVLAQTGAGSLVSYTRDQADRGEERYARDCQECHGDDLKGGLNGGPPLRGLQFEQKYAQGAPASWLFQYLSTAMPPNSPGRYSESIYADVMAYVLKRNGFQPGAALPSDLDALDTLIIEK